MSQGKPFAAYVSIGSTLILLNLLLTYYHKAALTFKEAQSCQNTNRSQLVGSFALISTVILKAKTGDFKSAVRNSRSSLW